MLKATAVRRAPLDRPAPDRIELDHDARAIRRKMLRTQRGEAFVVDLPRLVSLAPGDALELEDGRLVEIAAAPEPVLVATAPDAVTLARLAWHVGNRHTPCQIDAQDEPRLVIRHDHVLRGMLEGLGASVTGALAPFAPEGGAYGPAQVTGHDHGHGAQRHPPGSVHGHDHEHHDHRGAARPHRRD